MFRAILELIITIIVAMAARAILTSVMRGIGNAGRGSFGGGVPNNPSNQASSRAAPVSQPTGELHKDPVCGTYVADSTRFRRQVSGQTFYYCSDACREKHALVAR
jgi:YHS domain-containing protein